MGSHLTRRWFRGHCPPLCCPQHTPTAPGSWRWRGAAASAASGTFATAAYSDPQTLWPLSSRDQRVRRSRDKTWNVKQRLYITSGKFPPVVSTKKGNRQSDRDPNTWVLGVPGAGSSRRRMVRSPCGSPYSSSCKHWAKREKLGEQRT